MSQTMTENWEATNAEDRGKVLEKFWEKVDAKVKISKNAKDVPIRLLTLGSG
jgi:hypothetical protein